MVADHRHFWLVNSHAPDEQTGAVFTNDYLKETGEIRFEPIKTLKGVQESLRLRYLTYRYVNFIEENEDRLDIDPYDRYATFFGAYTANDSRRTLVGTVRIISGDERGECCEYVEELMRTARDPRIRGSAERSKSFPILESFEIPELRLGQLAGRKARLGGKVLHPHEISRLAVRPDYWLHKIDVGFHHLLILDSWLHKPPRNDFLIAVHPRSRRRYERIGFKVVPGTGEVLYKHINQLAIAMVIDLEKYLQRPRSYRETCASLLPFFEKHHYFTRITDRRNRERRVGERRVRDRRIG